MNNFNKFGVMLDCSRNAVMNKETLKNFIDILAKMGYNTLQLYTEDTYEVNNEPYFGYMRGRYTKVELKEIDKYAVSRGIELIPCIQTLAHVNQIIRWRPYFDIVDCDDILLAEDERTYELIENIFASLSECFSSRNVNIGMDEAHMVGLGKYLDKHGYKNRVEILKNHLEKVISIAEKYNFKPMMWSDMFFRLANKGSYDLENANLTEEIIKTVPKNLELIYWDYYSTEQKHFSDMMRLHKQFNNEIWFAGGAWTWRGFAPNNGYSIAELNAGISACKENGVKNVLITMWGDDGGECSAFAVLPALFYASEIVKGNDNLEEIKRKFKELTNYSWDEYLSLDLPDKVGKSHCGHANPSKYMFYNDIFSGYLDTTVNDGDGEVYEKYAQIINSAKNGGKYDYIFDTLSKFCKVLTIKYELGLKLRKAYKQKDLETLKVLIEQIKKLKKYVKTFYQAFKVLWLKENKPQGFEVQDLRIGGLILRLDSCLERLKDFTDGKINRIDELEESLINAAIQESNNEKETIAYNIYANIVSVNRV